MTGGIQLNDLIRSPDNHIVPAAQLVRAALPLFAEGSTRTLIVVDASGPVGVLRFQDVDELEDDALDAPAREHAVNVPVFERSMDFTVAHDQARSVTTAVDWLPVVNDNGRLAGIVAYDDLVIAADAEIADRGMAAILLAGGGEVDAMIEAGMDVYGSDGGKLGEIEQVVLENGRATYVVIKHGLIRHGRKRLPVTDIDAVENGNVRLAVRDRMFSHLPDFQE